MVIIFLGRSFTCDEILALLEDCFTDIYIESSDGNIIDEDSGEDGGGYIENLSGKQLLAPSMAALSSDCRITAVDDVPNLEHHFKNNIPKWSKKEKFKPNIAGFCAADHSGYCDFSSTELFKLFLDKWVWTLLVQQTILYATFKGDPSFIIDQNELKEFVAYYIIYLALCPFHPGTCFRKHEK